MPRFNGKISSIVREKGVTHLGQVTRSKCFGSCQSPLIPPMGSNCAKVQIPQGHVEANWTRIPQHFTVVWPPQSSLAMVASGPFCTKTAGQGWLCWHALQGGKQQR